MITAYQGAKLKAATIFAAAADELSGSLSLICLVQEDRHRLHKIITELHELFAKQIPNAIEGD